MSDNAIDPGLEAGNRKQLAGYRATADAWLSQGPVGEIATGMAALLFGAKYKGADAWIGKWQAKPPNEWAHPWETVLGRDEFLHRLPEIKCPSLVIHGSKDPLIPFRAGRKIAELTHGTWLPIAGMGHDMPEPLWPTIVAAIARHAELADSRAKV